jgi:Fe2+ or Zn2+ uptake regulation protein
LICAVCNGAQQIADDAVASALRDAAARHAWPAEGALVEIMGRCPACPPS